ncbi:translocation/assembly module TamB domain-containing protein [Rhodoferax sp. BLA1]|uniref:translocation/assembly module TamB domain-containing protein n=1 Tax=Rhodoferax sp. BLA1 TaxID=2576062 RepID=UPI0015D3CE11|nr:translocation/assembly module TamB domain-containing protein [Rhodoferax sp. BLA1]
MKRALRRSVWTLAGLLLATLGLLAGLWFWSGSDASLAATLQQVQRLLPAGQTLETRDVRGSVRFGGHIGWLRWQQGDLSVVAQDVDLAWEPIALLQRELRLSQLRIGHLSIQDQRAPTPAAPSTPPTDLGLPFQVDAQLRVDVLEWVGVSTQRVDKLAAHYVFDNKLHRLDKGQGQFLSNNVQFSGQLQASGPMALDVQAGATVAATVPGRAEPLPLRAQATLAGNLAGAQAELTLQADLKPASSSPLPGKTTKTPEMQASLSAQIAPWQAQAIVRAQGQWQALNLASLWPQAPQTGLSGQAQVQPQGSGWLAGVTLKNSLSGPWDQQRLPLQALQAELAYSGGHWLLQSLLAQGAGGHIQGQGDIDAKVGDSTGLWRGQVQVQGINPAAIDTRLAPDLISGTVSVHQTAANPSPVPLPSTAASGAASGSAGSPTPDTPFVFELALQSSARRTATAAKTNTDLLSSLQLRQLTAQGSWAAPLLNLSSLQLDAQAAKLQGQLKLNTSTLASQGQLSLQLPGLKAEVNGHVSSSDGLGTLSIQVQDAAQASQWLAHVPQIRTLLNGNQLRGTGALSTRWQGGWQQGAQAMVITTSLRAPELDWIPPAATAGLPLQLRDGQLDLSGPVSNLQLSSQGQLTRGTQQAHWQLQASGGRAKDASWQASLQQLALSLQQSGQSQPWRLQLGTGNGAASSRSPAQAVTLRWVPGANTNTLTVSAGTVRLLGPVPGTGGISWQPLQWSQPVNPGKGGKRLAQWRSQGRIDGLPLAWLDAFTAQPMAELGISSDLLLSGSWDAAQTDSLHLRATLERSAGDVRLQADAGRSTPLPAGMQEAWLQVNLDGEALSGSLRWDSQRAGKALAAFSTRLKTDSSGLSWPLDAPLGGSVQLQLPPVDAWSALAPPGWRLRGTVDSNINLNGTRAKPQWEGSLRARDLAVRSAVDGIDFSQGTLDARLHGQQLDIQNFTLRGAGTPQNAAAGGQLSVTGSVIWLPEAGQANIRQRVQMALQGQLNALRLSSRPDRRLVASGQLQAELKDAKLSLRGSLSADSALITLPDDSTPTLDEDVKVRRPPTPGSTPTAPASSSPAGLQITPDVLVNLDLGPDFQLRGRGLQARLAGKLVLTAVGSATPGLTGQIRTVNGTYQAYGQRLQIERGLIHFYGPIDNPALAILAIRPKLSQRVGVQISGTALSPVVSLYSDPSLSDVETLTWLVLGRSGSAGGAEAALMQQAAMALLGGNGKGISDQLTQALGLDELSFRGASEGSDSSNTASAASITLGKRLSQDFYVAYESSLGGAMGVFYIFYDLSRYLTLRAQTGEQSAVDLIWTRSYD